ncbi:MAG: cell division protein FtsA [Candidatus Faecivicinus sp.]
MKRQIAAIEFGTSKIVTMIAQNSGLDRLDIVGSGTVPYDGYSDGDWNTPRQMVQRVRDSIAAAEMEAGIKVSELYVGIPGEYIHVCSCEAEVDVPDGEIDDNVVNAVQDAAADYLKLSEGNCMVLHRTPAWYIVDDGKKTMSPYGRGNKLRALVTFIVAESVFIEDVSEMLRVLNITILGFLSPSLGESLLLLSLDDRDRASLLIDCGYLNTEISVVEGDAIVYHAMLPRGGGHITADLATELRIPMRAAEEIKRNYVFNPDEFDRDSFSEVFDASGNRMTFPREVISEIVEASVNELMDMIDLTIKNDAAQYLGSRSQVFLTGGGLALMRGGREYLSAQIGRPVKVAAAKSSKMNSPVYASALGLADLIFDSIEQHQEEEERLGGKVRNFFRSKKG